MTSRGRQKEAPSNFSLPGLGQQVAGQFVYANDAQNRFGSNLGFFVCLFFVFLNGNAQMLELVHLNISDTPKMPTG